MSKYGNIKAYADGIQFDSIKEKNRYIELKLMEKAGEISDLKLQVEYELIPPQKIVTGYTKTLKPKYKTIRGCSYKADFTYLDHDKNMVVEDVKGVKTDVYKLKKKLMLQKYGIYIKET